MIDGRNTTRPPGESEPVTVGEIRELAGVAARLDRIERAIRVLSVRVAADVTVRNILDPDRDKGAA